MADEGITFKTFGTDTQAATGNAASGPQPLSGSFAERAAAIRERAANQTGSADPSAVANKATVQNLSEGRVQPSDVPAADYAKMSWGEYIPKVASNVLPSTYEAVKGIGSAVFHPIDTASALGQIGTGLTSKALDAAGNAVGYGPILDPAKKAEREAIVDALGKSYSGRYGGGEEGEFWKHLAEDPASYLSDVASLATAGAGTATKLGLVSNAGKIAKAAELAGKLDPITLGLKATGKVAPVVGRAAPYGLMTAQSFASGVPMADLKMARQIALSGDPSQRAAFLSALKGKPKFAGEAADAYEGALVERMNKASDDYMTDQATAFSRKQPVDITGPTSARNTLNDMINPGGPYNRKSPYSDHDTLAAQKALDAIDNVITHPTATHTIESLDPVKKDLGTIADQIKDPTLKSRVYAVAGELVTAMDKTDPAYGRMMKTWSDALADVRKARSEIGGKNLSDATKAKRLYKSFKNNSRVFDTLEATPSGENLRYSLAGDAMKDWFSDRLHTSVAGLGGPLAAGMTLGMHPGVAMSVAPGIALSSPKLGGLSQYALGRTEKLVNKGAGFGVDALSYSPTLTNVASQYGAAREERKRGGRVSKHEADADQLVRAAERAKKGWSAQTEPLLNQSDDAVAHALEVANRSI